MRNRLAAALTLLIPLTPALTGCGWMNDPDVTGVVVERETERKKSGKTTKTVYEVDVMPDGVTDPNQEREFQVGLLTYNRCEVGKRWPDCRNG